MATRYTSDGLGKAITSILEMTNSFGGSVAYLGGGGAGGRPNYATDCTIKNPEFLCRRLLLKLGRLCTSLAHTLRAAIGTRVRVGAHETTKSGRGVKLSYCEQ